MYKTRRKVSTVLKDFQNAIQRLQKLDFLNQQQFQAVPAILNLKQLHFLTEAIFFTAIREYWAFLNDTFLLFTLGKPTLSGRNITAHISPRSFEHAHSLVKSSMRYLEWNSPDDVIERANVYLRNGFPIRDVYASNLSMLRDINRIRNQIAHNSKFAFEGYLKVLKGHYGVIPLRKPEVGEFLLLKDKKQKTKYKLMTYLDFLLDISNEITQNNA